MWARILPISLVVLVVTITGVSASCVDPGAPVNGTVDTSGSTGTTTGGQYNDWTILQFSCSDTHTLLGSTAMTCTTGGWQPPNAPTCKEKCDRPDPISNGYYEANFPVNGVSGTVSVKCVAGYTLAGADTIYCSDGSYGSYVPGVTSKCKESCSRPLLNAYVTIEDGFADDSDLVDSGGVITYGCIPGFSVVGPNQATCNDGNWDYTPQCIANCPMNAPPNARISGSNVHGGTSTVTCKAGFTPSDGYRVVCSYGVWVGEMPVCEDTLSDYISVYLPFENDFNDASNLGGYDGAKEGSVSFAENAGVYGSAASFAGKGRVDVKNDFVIYSAFSVSLWFKRTGNFDMFQGLVSHGGYGEVEGSELVLGDENHGQLLNAGLMTPGKRDTWDYVNVAATAHRWHHALYTYDGTEFNLYFDGEKQSGDSDCCSGPLSPGSRPIRIGQAGPPLLKQYFYGLIDEVYVFNIALNDTQADIMYRRDAWTCSDPDMLVHYTFDDGFKDSSCYGWHGVPYGKVWTSKGEAMFEDGQVNIEQFRNFMWGSDLTISFWYSCSECSEGSTDPETFPRNRKGLITNGLYSPGTFELALEDTASGTFIEGGFSTQGTHNNPREIQLPVTGPHHVTLVRDGMGSSLYLDGTRVGSSSAAMGDLLTVSSPVTVGVTGSGDPKYAHNFRGTIRDVRIYNKALTQQEITDLQ